MHNAQMSQKTPSFLPRYHEMREASDAWVPAYNPVRECVKEERAQLLAEGVNVDTAGWKMPWRVRRRVIEQKVERVGIEAMLWTFSMSTSALLFCAAYWAMKRFTG